MLAIIARSIVLLLLCLPKAFAARQKGSGSNGKNVPSAAFPTRGSPLPKTAPKRDKGKELDDSRAPPVFAPHESPMEAHPLKDVVIKRPTLTGKTKVDELYADYSRLVYFELSQLLHKTPGLVSKSAAEGAITIPISVLAYRRISEGALEKVLSRSGGEKSEVREEFSYRAALGTMRVFVLGPHCCPLQRIQIKHAVKVYRSSLARLLARGETSRAAERRHELHTVFPICQKSEAWLTPIIVESLFYWLDDSPEDAALATFLLDEFEPVGPSPALEKGFPRRVLESYMQDARIAAWWSMVGHPAVKPSLGPHVLAQLTTSKAMDRLVTRETYAKTILEYLEVEKTLEKIEFTDAAVRMMTHSAGNVDHGLMSYNSPEKIELFFRMLATSGNVVQRARSLTGLFSEVPGRFTSILIREYCRRKAATRSITHKIICADDPMSGSQEALTALSTREGCLGLLLASKSGHDQTAFVLCQVFRAELEISQFTLLSRRNRADVLLGRILGLLILLGGQLCQSVRKSTEALLLRIHSHCLIEASVILDIPELSAATAICLLFGQVPNTVDPPVGEYSLW